MRATWYLLEDGTPVDPSDCTADEKGNVITHKDGGVVAMRAPGVPSSRGVDLDEDGKLLFGGKGDHDDNGSAGGSKKADMTAEPKPKADAKPGYKTRGHKAAKSS